MRKEDNSITYVLLLRPTTHTITMERRKTRQTINQTDWYIFPEVPIYYSLLSEVCKAHTYNSRVSITYIVELNGVPVEADADTSDSSLPLRLDAPVEVPPNIVHLLVAVLQQLPRLLLQHEVDQRLLCERGQLSQAEGPLLELLVLGDLRPHLGELRVQGRGLIAGDSELLAGTDENTLEDGMEALRDARQEVEVLLAHTFSRRGKSKQLLRVGNRRQKLTSEVEFFTVVVPVN